MNKTENNNQEATASRLMRLLGTRGHLEVDFCRKQFGAIVAKSDEVEKEIILCWLPRDRAIGKKDADFILNEFIERSATKPLTPTEINRLL